MRRSRVLGLAVAGVILPIFASQTMAQIRAFGSAEGYGSVAMGARNGTPTVYHVTNLNATGAGSFVDAISVANRIIVFDVAGVINLTSAPSAKNNLYIAGQSAPGGGVTINGFQALGLANTSNNIVRHLRIRPGSQSPGSDNGIGMGVTGPEMLDHLSIEFGKYNNIDAVSTTPDRPLVTIQNSIIADPISNGTSNRGQGFGSHLEAVNGYFTLANNLWANSNSRNPLAKVNDQFINNIEYNNVIGYLTSGTSGVFNHDLVNNAFIFGPASGSSSDFGQLSTPDTFYASGNVQDTDKNGALNPTATSPSTVNPLSATPLHASTLSLPTLSIADAYAYVTAHVGASLVRDELDQLVLGQVQTLGLGTPGTTAGTTGPIVTDVPLDVESPFAGHTGLYHKSSDTGLSNNGLGTIASASRPAGFDSDNDGVADTWEATHGMNSASAADALQLNQLGYTMIEQYLNEIGDTNATRTYNATSGAISTAASWGGTAPLAMDNTKVVGTGAANGAATVSSGTFSVMKMDIGGNGPAAGEVVTVNGGKLSVYDTITVGAKNNATLNISSGTVDTWNIQIGNTDFSSGSAVNYTGTVNLSGGTLLVSSIMRGAGTVGNWNSGGTLNFSGGTIKAAGTLNINVPMVITGTGATIELGTYTMKYTTGTVTNSYNGTINGNMSGSGALTKTGVGTLTLVGNNSAYSGPIALTAGAITLGMNGTNSPTGLITLSNGTQLNVTTSGASTPMALASGATATLNGVGGLTYGGTISGPSNATLLVVGTSTGTSNFSLGASMTGFAGTLDFTNGHNVRINAGGSAAAKFVMGNNASPDNSLIRVPFGTTLNMGSLSGGATSIIQGATNDAVTTVYSIGALNTSTTYSGIFANGTNATVGLTSVTKVGAGTLTLNNAASTYTGVTTVSGGTLAVTTLANGAAVSSIGQSSNAAANLVFDGGTLQYTGAAVAIDRLFTVTANGGAIDASGTGTLDLNNVGAAVVSGTGNRAFTLTGTNTGFNNFRGILGDPSSGQTSLNKSGAGTWRLFSAQTYSGNTNVSGGLLYLVTANTLPNGAGKGSVTVASGATIEMYGNNQSFNALNGAGTVTTTLNTARTLTLGAGDASGAFTGVLTQGATQTLSLFKTGAGTQSLGGTSTYSGSTTISGAGTLAVTMLANGGAPSSIGQSTNAAASLLLDGGTLKYTGATTSTDRLFTLSGNGGKFDASGSGALTLSNTASANITGTGNRTLTFTGTSTAANTSNVAIADPSSGKTALAKTGTGTWVIGGTQTYTGDTTVSDGTLQITGSYLPATPGALNVSGAGIANINAGQTRFAKVTATNLSLQSTGRLSIPANGTTAATSEVTTLSIVGNSQLDIANNALVIRATGARNTIRQLVLSGENGVDANSMVNWDGPGIISSTARSMNVAASINLYAVGVIRNGDLDDRMGVGNSYTTWYGKNVTNSDTLVKFTYNGDTNLDGTITFSDYVNIDTTYGGILPASGWASGDFNDDGSIGIEDYVAIDTAYAFQTGSLSQSFLNVRAAQFGPAYITQMETVLAQLQAVPEPASLGLLSLGAVALLARRRRK